MIDKIIEELVRLRIENAPIYHDDDYEQGYKQAMNDVEEIVKKYDNDGWVLCSERLPKEYSEVYITNDFGSVCHLFYSRKEFRFGSYDSSTLAIEVIAWKPFELPQPYKGE